jgi:DNA-directed RNA polymerase subunit RPC12/RpoP
MNINDINNLLENVVEITYKNNEKLIYNKLEFKKIKHKYSNTKQELYRIFIDNNCISRNNPYRVSYKCITCNKVIIVNLNNLVRKMNKNIKGCIMCRNLDITKRNNQSNFMKNSFSVFGKIKSKKTKKEKLTVEEFLEKSIEEFEEFGDDYSEKYFNKHLTSEEFDIYKNKIISFQNDKFTDINNFKYCPIVKIFNQTYFNPYLLDKKRMVLEKPIYLKFKCDCCDNEFIHRDLHIIKNKIKILCNNCSLVNKTFKIRNYKNCLGKKINYQSKYELKFINFCNKNNIELLNGPKIKYNWKNKDRKYVVDFYIPKIDTLIELKDNHVWHLENKKNGKLDAKLNSVKMLIKQGKYKDYLCIYPKNYVSLCKKIKNDNLV